METSTIIVVALIAIVVLLAIIAYKLLWTVAKPQIEHRVSQIGLTENEKAANGPLPGDVGLYETELHAAAAHTAPGYYPTLGGAEIADAQRSGLFPAASFTGSFNGPNKVFAWRGADHYESCTFIVNRKPGEIYIVGGDNPPMNGPIPPGPYVAKADATTGREIWRTYLDNANASGRWIGAANLNVLANGHVPFCWGTQIVLLDGDTGLILKKNDLPSGDAPPADTNFKHLTVAPDGTLICKSQTRPTGNKMQGTLAILKGIDAGLKQPNSNLVAVHPETLEILAEFSLPEPATVPHIIGSFNDRIAIYVGMDSGCRRVFWDPDARTLTLDDTWHMQAVQEGQTTACAPSIIGDWVVLQMNGLGSKVKASSVAVGHVADSRRMEIIFPFGELEPGGWSFVLPKACVDRENNMIYSADMGVSKVAGIKIDPVTGKLNAVFVLNNMTNTFQPTYGPKEKRVLVLTNMKPNVKHEPAMAMFGTANYTEQVTWHDAATGRKLAESDFFEPLTINSLIAPGFGGRFYYPTKKGFITLQVKPATAA